MLYAKYGAIPVFFETIRVSAKGGHAHIQVIPVPEALKDRVEATFIREGMAHGIEFEEEAPDAKPGTEKGSYFKFQMPGGRKMVHWMKDGVPFNVQFGRCVHFIPPVTIEFVCSHRRCN
jgi:Protein similar to CwfJ C-terminus 1